MIYRRACDGQILYVNMDMQSETIDAALLDTSLANVPILQPPTSPFAPLLAPMPPSHGMYPEQVRSRKPRQERKAACTACRQQKLKCDAYLDPENPCARCRRLRLECFRQPGFQRLEVRKSRQARSTYDEEASKQSSADHISQYASSSTASGTSPVHGQVYDLDGKGPHFVSNTTSDVLSIHLQHMQVQAQPILSSPNNIAPNSSSQPAESRRLADFHVDGKIIDECFQIFFTKYSPLLPIFHSRVSPDECHTKSPTLFWAIVLVASRSLGSDPTLLRGLGGEVLNVALTSFQSMKSLIDDIKGLLLLCTWPCPTTTILRDNTVALSGLLLSLSMQAGLHAPNTQFSRFGGAGVENQPSERAALSTLWAHVVTACGSVMSLGGYTIALGTVACFSFEKTSWQLVPNELKLRYKTQRILAEAQSAIIELALEDGLIHNHAQILARIELLVSKLNCLDVEFSANSGSALDTLYTQSARLQVEVIQLYGIGDAAGRTGLLNLFRAALTLIASTKRLDETASISSHSPMYLSTSLALAAYTLLRMMKSRFIDILDETTAEEGRLSLFTAIRILKQISLVNNDIYAKSAEMLSLMWRHPAIFTSSNPSSFWTLRIRNRLTMSVVFDTVAIWLKDYSHCTSDIAAASVRKSKGNKTQMPTPGAMETSYTAPGLVSTASEPAEQQSMSKDSGIIDTLALPADDRWLYELDWNAPLDVLMADQAGANLLSLNWPLAKTV